MKLLIKGDERINLDNLTDWNRIGNHIFFYTGNETNYDRIPIWDFDEDHDAICAMSIIDDFCANLEMTCVLG